MKCDWVKKNIVKKITLVLCVVVMQLFLLENFERFFYQFEQRYNQHVRVSSTVKPPVEKGSLEKIVLDATVDLGVDVEVVACSKPRAPAENAPFYQYDEFGFRTWDVDYDKKCGKRILFIGSNSIGMGYGVSVDKTFPARFGQKIAQLKSKTNIEIVNMNLPGHPLPKNMEVIKDIFFNKIKPDVVVYGAYLYSTDLQFLSLPGETLAEKVFGTPVQTLNVDLENELRQHRDIAVKPRLNHSRAWKWLSCKSLLMAKFLTYLDIKMADVVDGVQKLFSLEVQDNIDRAGYLYDLYEFLSQEKIPLLIVDLPNSKNNDLNKEIQFVANRLQIPYLGVRKMRKSSEYTWVENGHYSEKTNEVIGHDIAKWVNDILDDDLQLTS